MPPWAALECERTGWTLETIPTETPSSAAASAARWPVSPAPITSTSCLGMDGRSYWLPHASGTVGDGDRRVCTYRRDGTAKCTLGCVGWSASSDGRRLAGGAVPARGERAAERPADLISGDHAPQMPLLVDGHERAEPGERV